MARLLYALTAQGRGHLSRVTATAEGLEARGHELLFVCGGFAARELQREGRQVVRVPVIGHIMHDNAIRLWASLARIGAQRLHSRRVIDRLTRRFEMFEPEALITDFEQYSARAARRMGLPVLSFTHQQVVTHTMLVSRGGFEGALARAVIRSAAPRAPEHVLITSFFNAPVRKPGTTTLVGPVLRNRVLGAKATEGDHLLVYHNDPTGFGSLLTALGEVPANVVAYGFEPLVGSTRRWKNVHFRSPCAHRFVEDLRSARAVVGSAGHNMISETMLLDKPLLAIPNRRNFEQSLNATYVVRLGGHALPDGRVSGAALRGFLKHASRRGATWRATLPPGNTSAVGCIERFAAEYAR